MTVNEIITELGLTAVAESGVGADKTPDSVYCCDLLSIVMGRAPENSVWITVMANLNTVAVAVLADVACVILSEGVSLDDETVKKAREEGVCVYSSELPSFEIAKKVDALINP